MLDRGDVAFPADRVIAVAVRQEGQIQHLILQHGVRIVLVPVHFGQYGTPLGLDLVRGDVEPGHAVGLDAQ